MKTKLSDAAFLPHEIGDAAFLPHKIGDAAFLPQKIGDADSLPHETGGAAFLPNNIGDAAFLPQNNINDFRQECRNSYQFLEKNQYVHIWGTNLPHWHQDGKTQFVTFRLADSIPQSKIEELKVYKQEWMKAHPFPWSQEVQEEYTG